MEINVEKIMDEIKAEIKEKGYTSDVLSFNEAMENDTACAEGFDKGELLSNVNIANAVCVVPLDRPIKGNPIAVFIKRLIRKLVRFYLRPVVEQQNEYNVVMVRAVSTVGRFAIEQQSRVSDEEMQGRINSLEQKLELATKENEELRARLERLEKAFSENSK